MPKTLFLTKYHVFCIFALTALRLWTYTSATLSTNNARIIKFPILFYLQKCRQRMTHQWISLLQLVYLIRSIREVSSALILLVLTYEAMPKVKGTLSSRMRQWIRPHNEPVEIFSTDGQKIRCLVCEKELNCSKKNHVGTHCQSGEFEFW